LLAEVRNSPLVLGSLQDRADAVDYSWIGQDILGRVRSWFDCRGDSCWFSRLAGGQLEESQEEARNKQPLHFIDYGLLGIFVVFIPVSADKDEGLP
jgi:hypothetical protein